MPRAPGNGAPENEHRLIRRTVKTATGGAATATKGLVRSSPARREGGGEVRELIRTNDVVKLSWLQALLADAGIEAVVLDVHTSIIEGSIGAIPRRLAVSDEDYDQARRVLTAAGEEAPS